MAVPAPSPSTAVLTKRMISWRKSTVIRARVLDHQALQQEHRPHQPVEKQDPGARVERLPLGGRGGAAGCIHTHGREESSSS